MAGDEERRESDARDVPAQEVAEALASLEETAAQACGEDRPRAPAPVERWSPPFCGDIGLRVARDGRWFYRGSPIERPTLVRLFASILRKDPDRYLLVTPAESVSVAVDDAPFAAVEMVVAAGTRGEQVLRLRTNVGDWTEAGPAHPLRFETDASGGFKPYAHVRGGLWALFSRPLAVELTNLCEARRDDGGDQFGVSSGGAFFAIAGAAGLLAGGGG